jgi:hypothetical protein
MNNWSSKFGYTLLFCLIQLALVKYGQFAFGGIMFIFGLFGALIYIMGHKAIGFGMVVGMLIFSFVLLLFGGFFMEGWISPEKWWENYQKK